MKLESGNKEKLRELYQQAVASESKVPAHFSPAKFRETQLETHRTLPPEDLKLKPHTIRANYASRTSSTQSKRRTRCAANSQSGTTEFDQPATSEYRSTFKPSPEQQHVSELASTRRALKTGSEWALLDQLETSMAVAEVEARRQAKLHQQHEQSQYLAQQVAAHERERAAANAAKAAALAEVVASVDAYHREEEVKEAQVREKHLKLKADREVQAAAVEAERRRKEAKRAREEAAALESIRRQLEAARAAQARKQAEAAAAMAKTLAENEAHIAARRQAENEQKKRDEALMQETIRTLEKQEHDREAALEAFHASIAARAAHVGEIAVAANNARQEREDRLIKQSEERALQQQQEKIGAEKVKREQMAAELCTAAAEASSAKQAALQQRQEEQAQLRAEMEAELAEFKLTEALTAEQRRKRNQQHHAALHAQIADMERRMVADDIGMDDRERALNARLLQQAKTAMAALKQYR
eukprot:jgi/Chrzof1/2519/Cz11g18180.t1